MPASPLSPNRSLSFALGSIRPALALTLAASLWTFAACTGSQANESTGENDDSTPLQSLLPDDTSSASTRADLTIASSDSSDGTSAPEPSAPEPTPPQREIRGTWLTTTANDAIASPAQTAATMQRLSVMGLNTVYVECWKNGYTEFPSQVMADTIGVPMRINNAPEEGQRDLLGETLIEAHRNGLIYVAWFEYGFMAAYTETFNHLREDFPEWMTTTRDGELVSDQNPFVWMNPLHPECRALLLGIIVEAVEQYDLDGIQLDDRIAWPVTMGYDPFTLGVYRAEHDGADPPADPRDPAWIAWRAAKVTEFAHELETTLRAIRPNLIVSISPAIYPWSLENYACDWKAWSDAGWMDEYVPQAYRLDYEAFSPTWDAQVEAAGDRVDDLIAGIRVVGDGPPTTWPDVERKIRQVRASGAAGHCLWFSRGVLNVYPEPFERFYAESGPAVHTHLPIDWRPAPIEARRPPDAPLGWVADVPTAGRYRLIARRGDAWKSIVSLELPAGEVRLDRAFAQAEETDDLAANEAAFLAADAVELLVDRRSEARILAAD